MFEEGSRVGIEDGSMIASLQGVQWRYCSNVVVLMLVGVVGGVEGVLNLKELRCLRSLDLMGLKGAERIEGLEDLKNLTHFQCSGDNWSWDGIRGPYLGPLPASLKVLRSSDAGIQAGRGVFGRCINLCELILHRCFADDGLDFSNCKSLRSVELFCVIGLCNLAGMQVAGLRSCLKSLKMSCCYHMSDVSELEHFISLQHLEIEYNDSLRELPNLRRLLIFCPDNPAHFVVRWRRFAVVPGLDSLLQLRELDLYDLDVIRQPNLSGFSQLQVLSICGCEQLISVVGLGDLFALRRLSLSGCSRLSSLSDLSKLTNLKDLELWGTAIELYEETIRMLAKLPLLGPVSVQYANDYDGDIKVDMVRWRVLDCDREGRVRRERDLGTPPIILREFEF